MHAPVFERLTALENRHRRLVRLVVFQSALIVSAAAALAAGCESALGRDDSKPSRVRVEEIVVVDSTGVERVRIGGNLPDAVVDGRRAPRGEDAAGLLLYDGTGRERGGYVTWEPSGNVGLTLDSRQRQVALFVAGPDGGSAMSVRHGDDLVELRSDGDGSRLTAVEGGRVVVQEPEVEVGSEACAAYRDARERRSEDVARAACRRRYPGPSCEACLARVTAEPATGPPTGT